MSVPSSFRRFLERLAGPGLGIRTGRDGGVGRSTVGKVVMVAGSGPLRLRPISEQQEQLQGRPLGGRILFPLRYCRAIGSAVVSDLLLRPTKRDP